MPRQPLLSLKDGRALSLEAIENDLTTASLILTGAIGIFEDIMADTDLHDSFFPKMHMVTAAIGRAVDLVESAIPDSEQMRTTLKYITVQYSPGSQLNQRLPGFCLSWVVQRCLVTSHNFEGNFRGKIKSKLLLLSFLGD